MLGAGDSKYLIGLDTFDANVTDKFDRQVYVKIADGIDAATATSALEATLEQWPNAELQDQASFKEAITSEIDTMLNLIYGLLALAVIIALIGIANTLALSVHERTRELGLLRAVGMTRHQLRTAIRWESVLISLFGTALGFVLGVGGAWGITKALADEGVSTFVLPSGQMVVIVGLAVLAGVLAALGPARRAGRLNVLEAIATPVIPQHQVPRGSVRRLPVPAHGRVWADPPRRRTRVGYPRRSTQSSLPSGSVMTTRSPSPGRRRPRRAEGHEAVDLGVLVGSVDRRDLEVEPVLAGLRGPPAGRPR